MLKPHPLADHPEPATGSLHGHRYIVYPSNHSSTGAPSNLRMSKLLHIESHDSRWNLAARRLRIETGTTCKRPRSLSGFAAAAIFALAPLVVVTAQEPTVEPAPKSAPKSPPNAAKIYDRAFQELRRAFRVANVEQPWLPFNEHDEPAQIYYTNHGWPALVKTSALARNLFEQATAIRFCSFAEKGQRYAEDFPETVARFSDLRALVVADAWQQLHKRPAASLRASQLLLAHARHLGDDAFVLGSLLRIAVENDALSLVNSVLEVHQGKALPRAALTAAITAIDAQTESSPTGALLAKKLKGEARHFLTMRIASGGENVAALAVVTERVIELIGEVVDPIASVKPQDLGAFRKASEARLQALKAKVGKGKLRNVLETGVGELLATAMACKLVTDPVGLIDEVYTQNKRRAETRRRLAMRLAALGGEALRGGGR